MLLATPSAKLPDSFRVYPTAKPYELLSSGMCVCVCVCVCCHCKPAFNSTYMYTGRYR